MARTNGKQLAKLHGIHVAVALYRETGDWYHIPRDFPAALFDINGYLKFDALEIFEEFIRAQRSRGVIKYDKSDQLSIRGGISSFPGYVEFRYAEAREQSEDHKLFKEGSKQFFVETRYERDPKARRACILKWGFDCSVCGMNFERQYGELGKGFIHVHHLVPISEIGSQYELNAQRDLRPVCPNCHSMLHRGDSVMKIEDLRAIILRKP